MSWMSRSAWRSRAALAADAGVTTAGMLGVLLGLDMALWWVGDRLGAPGLLLEGTSSLVLVGGGLLSPMIAWRLYGRRISWASSAGAAVGVPVGGAAVFATLATAGLVNMAVKSLTGSEYAGLLAFLALFGAAFAALVGWLDIGAVRDLSSKSSEHRGMDVARILATLSIVAVAVFSAWEVTAHPGTESGEGVIFLMVACVGGGVMAAAADALVAFMDERKAAAAESSAS